MNVGGLSRRIVVFAMALVGHVKGGLGYVTIIAAVSWHRCRARPWQMRPR